MALTMDNAMSVWDRDDIMTHFAHAHPVSCQMAMCKRDYKRQRRITELWLARWLRWLYLSPLHQNVHLLLHDCYQGSQMVVASCFSECLRHRRLVCLHSLLCSRTSVFVWVLVSSCGSSLHRRPAWQANSHLFVQTGGHKGKTFPCLVAPV